MLEIRFRPESDQPALVAAAEEYRALWEAEGERIVRAFVAVTRLAFAEAVVDAVVFEGPSQSTCGATCTASRSRGGRAARLAALLGAGGGG